MSKEGTARFYPEVMSAGSLGDAILRRFDEMGSSLEVTSLDRNRFPLAYARVAREPRSSQIYLAAEERLFLTDYWDNGVCLAQGSSPDFEAIVSSVDQWVGGRTTGILNLASEYSFISVDENAEAHENGTEVEVRWLQYLQGNRLAGLHPDLPELIRAAHGECKLRRLFPYTSLGNFHLSRCTGYPFTRDTPWFQPLGNRRFRVVGAAGYGDEMNEGSAEYVVRIAADQLPDDILPAWVGTAGTGSVQPTDLEFDGESQ